MNENIIKEKNEIQTGENVQQEQIQSILYVQLEEGTDIVRGYSSTRMHDNDIEVIESEMEEHFLCIPVFYKYDRETEKFIYVEDIKNKIEEDRKNVLSDSQKIQHLAAQIADEKLKSMKKDIIINNLMRQQALTKLEIMNLKGEK